jgi:hypothetical protein
VRPVLWVYEEEEVSDPEQREEDERRPDGLLDLRLLRLLRRGRHGRHRRGGRRPVVDRGHHDAQNVDQEEEIHLNHKCQNKLNLHYRMDIL